MKVFKLVLFFVFALSYSQNQPNDCVNAVTICGNGNFSSNSSGIGTIQEVSGCSGFEHNSIWLKINIVQGGTLGFDLIPNDPNINVDYDFDEINNNIVKRTLSLNITEARNIFGNEANKIFTFLSHATMGWLSNIDIESCGLYLQQNVVLLKIV